VKTISAHAINTSLIFRNLKKILFLWHYLFKQLQYHREHPYPPVWKIGRLSRRKAGWWELSAGSRKMTLIECIVKCLHLKNWPVKGLCGRCFICLNPFLPSYDPILPPTRHTYTSIQYTYSLIQLLKWRRGELTCREKVRGAIVH
jgi:hypothetical protein